MIDRQWSAEVSAFPRGSRARLKAPYPKGSTVPKGVRLCSLSSAGRLPPLANAAPLELRSWTANDKA
jgi:hypothetical protein